MKLGMKRPLKLEVIGLFFYVSMIILKNKFKKDMWCPR
jgi:hypothetical protein